MKRIPKRVGIPVTILVAALLSIGLAGVALAQSGHVGNGPLPNFARFDSGFPNSIDFRDRDIRSGSGELGTCLGDAGFDLDELRTAKQEDSLSDAQLAAIDECRGEHDGSGDKSGRHHRAGSGTCLADAGFDLDELRTATQEDSLSDAQLAAIDECRGEHDGSGDKKSAPLAPTDSAS